MSLTYLLGALRSHPSPEALEEPVLTLAPVRSGVSPLVNRGEELENLPARQPQNLNRRALVHVVLAGTT